MAISPQNPADSRKLRHGHGAKTAATRERAIVALLSERTIEAAATRAGVDESTLRRWLAKDEAFQAEYDAARRMAFQAAMNRVHALTARAVETLEDLLGAEKHPSVRLGAARTVAEIGIHQHDAETIMRKLDDIEAAQRQQRR
jgi:alpha-beta hydrolase superfamily lysophospholipase